MLSNAMAGVVLIAIDATSQAEKALNYEQYLMEKALHWYLDHLHRQGNRIVILHSIDLSAITSTVDGEHTSEATFTLWHQQKQKIKALEDKYRWKLNELGLTGKIRTESGKPGEKIIQVAKEEKAGLIVIGSRGLSKLKRTFSSASVSDYVLHHSPCPVVVCRMTPSSVDPDFELRRESTASMTAVATTSYADAEADRRARTRRLMSEPEVMNAPPTSTIEIHTDGDKEDT